MMRASVEQPKPGQRQWLFLGGMTLVMLVAMVILGGLPPEQEMPAFFAGVTVLVAGVAVFGLVAWHLMLRPLPAGHKSSLRGTVPAVWRRFLALLATIGGLNIVVGGFWDEVWHRKYGLPFGEDLFWRPHLLIYSSFLVTILLAAGGLFMLVTRGKGTLQQRFRAEPVVGLLVLAGGFLLFVTPADPLWHIIYGEDISAWSLPHILLLVSSSISLLLAAALQCSTILSRSWRLLWRTPIADLAPRLLVILALALASQIGLQVLTTEWDATSRIVMERPEWLLPALLAGYASLLGAIGLHATRTAGVASVTGLIALGLRLGLINLFDYPEVKAYSWIVLLPPLVTLDLVYGSWLLVRRRSPGTLFSGLATAAGMLLAGLPLIDRLYAFPSFGPANLLPAAVAILASALLANLGGELIGRQMANLGEGIEDQVTISWTVRFIPSLALVGSLAFIILFVATARPPV